MILQNLSVIEYGGTSMNTGWKGRVLRLLETYIHRKTVKAPFWKWTITQRDHIHILDLLDCF